MHVCSNMIHLADCEVGLHLRGMPICLGKPEGEDFRDGEENVIQEKEGS